jgi:hypothetical protein
MIRLMDLLANILKNWRTTVLGAVQLALPIASACGVEIPDNIYKASLGVILALALAIAKDANVTGVAANKVINNTSDKNT